MTIPRSITVVDSVDPADWAIIVTAKPNVLLCGDKPFTDALLAALLPHCRPPVQRLPRHFGHLSSWVSAEGTLLLPKVDTYDQDEQAALVEWLENDAGPVQLISTTDSQVVDLVERGEFLGELFYCLNIVYLDVGCPPTHDTWTH